MLAVGELAEAIEEKFYEIDRRAYEQKRRETDEWWENEIAEFSERMRGAGWEFRKDGRGYHRGIWFARWDVWVRLNEEGTAYYVVHHLGAIAEVWANREAERVIFSAYAGADGIITEGELKTVPTNYVLCVETKSWIASCDCEKNIPPFPVDLLIDILKN
jgi:hypothetical protein